MYLKEISVKKTPIDRIVFNGVCFDGSFSNSTRRPIFLSSPLGKHDGYQKYCKIWKVQKEKLDISFSKTITFYLENDGKKNECNGGTLILTLIKENEIHSYVKFYR